MSGEVCYNEAVRQRRVYKEKPKEAKPLTRNAKSGEVGYQFVTKAQFDGRRLEDCMYDLGPKRCRFKDVVLKQPTPGYHKKELVELSGHIRDQTCDMCFYDGVEYHSTRPLNILGT